MRSKFIRRLAIGLVCLSLFSFAEEPPEDLLPVETAPPLAEPTQPPGQSMLDTDGILCLVNRDLKITKHYVPADLRMPEVATRKKGMEERILMREEAAQALEKMFQAAKWEAKYTLYAASGYRSYGIQQILFNGKVEAVGSRDAAQKTVAPPGTSEHQLGLAMDVQAPSLLNLNRAFGDTEEGKWVAENAHRFGFIIRYKREWTDITGYLYEPWHIRYVGVAHARAIYALDVPLETYVAAVSQLPEYVLRGGSDLLLEGLARQLMAEVPQQPAPDLMGAQTPEQQDAALRAATAPYLPAGASYEQVLWAVYPTPKPTAGPRIDADEETSLFSSRQEQDVVSP